jgi:anti-sigma factor RsiW
MNMNCDEMLKALNEYVDGTLPTGICEQFEQHLAGCDPCQIVVDNIRKTITLLQERPTAGTPIAAQRPPAPVPPRAPATQVQQVILFASSTVTPFGDGV